MFTDLPITHNGQAVTLDTAPTLKKANGYTCENETVSYPMAEGTDGNIYHLSVLRAANFQELLVGTDQDGIPYKSASNTECGLIKNLYFGEEYRGSCLDDETINEKLNKYGIASAAYVGKRWAL